MSEATTEVTLWASREDNDATLCGPCGIEELNSTVAVMIGLLPPFASVDEANEWYVENYPDEGFSEESPAFRKTTEGTCLNCGATNEVTDADDASDVA